MTLPIKNIQNAVQEQQAALIDFTQRIIQIPSPPGQEAEIASVISQEMETLGYDKVWRDEAGNLIGEIKGGTGPKILLNGHMDHVDPGPASSWPYPPFSGQVVEGNMWGRGTVDMKGPMACMLYATALFKQMNITPPGDILMTVPVMEEAGGIGTQYLATHLQAAAAICGEPSRNILRRGHRGRVEIRVVFKGRSGHASMPHLSLNPHYAAAILLSHLPTLSMIPNAALGPSTVSPTLYTTDQKSPNVIPGKVEMILDWRNVPEEPPQAIVEQLEKILASCSLDEGIETEVEITHHEFTTYTGLTNLYPSIFPSYLLAEEDRFVQAAQSALSKIPDQEAKVDIWNFATDGGHLTAAGIPTVGFGPGDERLAHTNQEHINLDQMAKAVVAYTAMTLALAEAAG